MIVLMMEKRAANSARCSKFLDLDAAHRAEHVDLEALLPVDGAARRTGVAGVVDEDVAAAERIRRAVVTESMGTREAAINVAEGEKQAAILRAEGQKQSAILEAEGLKQSQELKAEGFSAALEQINQVAQSVEQKTMTLQYFDTLKSLGLSPATKYIFPMEFTSLLENFTKKNN